MLLSTTNWWTINLKQVAQVIHIYLTLHEHIQCALIFFISENDLHWLSMIRTPHSVHLNYIFDDNKLLIDDFELHFNDLINAQCYDFSCVVWIWLYFCVLLNVHLLCHGYSSDQWPIIILWRKFSRFISFRYLFLAMPSRILIRYILSMFTHAYISPIKSL